MTINIKKPCADCPLVGSGEGVLDIFDKRLLPMCKDGVDRALGCKHPWRVANVRFGGEPNTPQRMILSQLVELRGLDPMTYGLEPSEKSPETPGLEDDVLEQEFKGIIEDDHKLEVIRTIADELTIVFMSQGSEEDVIRHIEETMTEYASDPDIPTEWVDEALKVAQTRMLKNY